MNNNVFGKANPLLTLLGSDGEKMVRQVRDEIIGHVPTDPRSFMDAYQTIGDYLGNRVFEDHPEWNYATVQRVWDYCMRRVEFWYKVACKMNAGIIEEDTISYGTKPRHKQRMERIAEVLYNVHESDQ